MIQDQLRTLCTAEQWSAIEQFVAAVLSYNTKVNLISRQDTAAIYEHHVAPSVLFCLLNRLQPGERILDIGSGGGFPGIINAILWPTSQFVLVDSTQKKVHFLQEVSKQLDLANVTAYWARIEKLPNQPTYRGTFDHTTSRAVAALAQLVQWSTPLVKPGGTVEALKGGDISAELAELAHPYTVHTVPLAWQLTEQLKSTCIVSIQL